jgi:hypothetical protein
MWKTFECDELPAKTCRSKWAKKNLPDGMNCKMTQQQCKDKASCLASGECDMQYDHRMIQEAGGICIIPHNFSYINSPQYQPGDGRGKWDMCQQKNNGGGMYRYEARGFGCLVQKTSGRRLQDSGSAMTADNCTSLGGRYFPAATKKSECESPGFAFAKSTPGTMMCCTRVRRGGGNDECDDWSMDDTEQKCQACGGKWMSFARWRSYSQWITPKWSQQYQWKQRKLEQVNYWVTSLEHWKVFQAWENAVQSVRAKPMANFLQCRINPTLDTLAAIAEAKLPVPTLGEAQVLPGQETTQEMGEFSVSTSKTTNTGSQSVKLVLALDGLGNNVGQNSTSRRLAQSSPRQLQSSSSTLDIDKLEASCYAVVKVSSKAVGQLIGDCAQFSPSGTLTGPAEICFGINANIPVNPNMTKYGFALKGSNGVYTVQTGNVTLTTSGLKLCGNFQSANTYCPIKYDPNYTPGQALPANYVGADDSCGTLKAVEQTISTSVKTLQDAGFQGSGNLVKVGATTPPPSTNVADTQGSLLTSSGEVTNINTFVATATQAPTFTTTTTTTTTTVALQLFGGGPSPASTSPEYTTTTSPPVGSSAMTRHAIGVSTLLSMVGYTRLL